MSRSFLSPVNAGSVTPQSLLKATNTYACMSLGGQNAQQLAKKEEEKKKKKKLILGIITVCSEGSVLTLAACMHKTLIKTRVKTLDFLFLLRSWLHVCAEQFRKTRAENFC